MWAGVLTAASFTTSIKTHRFRENAENRQILI